MSPRTFDRNPYSLARGDELEGHGGSKGNKRSSFSGHRKMTKMMKAQHSPNSLRRKVQSAGESDSSEEEQGEVAEEDHAAQPDDTEDDEGEPKVYAPSGASKLQIGASNRNKKLHRSALSSKSAHQAGRVRESVRLQRKSGKDSSGQSSPTAKRTTRSTTNSPVTVDADLEMLDLDATSSDDEDDDDVYALVDMLSDDDEDDLEVEALEEKMLLEEMDANGELQEIEMLFGSYGSMFPDANSVPYIPSRDGTDWIGDRYGIPEEGLEALLSGNVTDAGDSTPKASKAATPFESDTEMGSLSSSVMHSALTSPLTGSFPLAPLDVAAARTGLCTPNSLKQPLNWCCDPEETDEEEILPIEFAVPFSVLKKKFRSPSINHISAAGIRKNKKLKTPKAGTFQISKKDVCLSHDKSGKLVLSGNKKPSKSGFNTPKGIVPVDPAKMTPGAGPQFPNANRTLSFGSTESPLSPVEQATAMLFASTTSLSGPLFSADANNKATLPKITDEKTLYLGSPLLRAATPAEEDMSRFVDFLA